MNIFKNAPKTLWFTPESRKWRATWEAIYEAEKALVLEKLKEELNNEK